MSLIKDLANIMIEAEQEYLYLLEYGMNAEYKRELAVPGESRGADAGAQNRIYHCDNLLLLSDGIRSGSLRDQVDLIYCDPPFFTKTKQEVTVEVYCSDRLVRDEDEVGIDDKHASATPELKKVKLRQRAYSDMWNRDIADYLRMIAVRLYFMRDALSETGSIFIHLDWHAVHAVKLIMDEIFGEENFVNEIIWTYKSGGAAKRHFSRKHDTILFYSKSENYKFNEQEKEKSYNRDFRPYHFKGVQEFQDKKGWYTLVNPRDVWQIDMLGRSSSERLNYATQKPEALLEKIIRAVTEPGDLCADFFCGSGTLAAAAAKLERRFLCADAGGLAIANSMKRPLMRSVAFELWSAKPADKSAFSDSENIKPELPLRPSDMQKGIEILNREPEAFTDYRISGVLDTDGCILADSVEFRTHEGSRKINFSQSPVADDERSGDEHVMSVDVFGRRNILWNIL